MCDTGIKKTERQDGHETTETTWKEEPDTLVSQAVALISCKTKFH